MANVNVDDRGTRSGSIQTGLRDLLGRDRQCWVLIRAGQIASDGASENGFHRSLAMRMLQFPFCAGSHAGV